MFTLHIISDLDYGDTEHNELAEDNVPDVDLIILNGNLASLKRSLHFAMTLADKRPSTQIVYNPGDLELYRFCFPKYEDAGRESLRMGELAAEWWRPNLHYFENGKILDLRNGDRVDVMCLMGWPKIHSVMGEWEDTWLFKNIIVTSIQDPTDPYFLKHKPKETSIVNHFYPRWADVEWINAQHEIENKKAKEWELKITGYKVLVTQLNPYNDTRLKNLSISPYEIHLNNGLWVTSESKVESVKFLGARLVSNPGRGESARAHIVNVNT